MRIVLALFIVSFAGFLISCENRTGDQVNIEEVRIGDQVWMAKNYDGVVFRNGDSIPQARSVEEWVLAGESGKPAWCYYENDSSYGRKYGRIYNWYAVNDPRGLCPPGWHVPTNDEWIVMENFLGVSEVGKRLKSDKDSTNNSVNNKFGLLMGGYRGKEGGFSGVEVFTYLSSSTERDPKENDIWGRGIHAEENGIMRCGLFKEHGLYVRGVKD
ncbi:MAG TPA: fibrobacter succinogenes major paralogous domain-containing protein [Chitinophagaceae bacterium]|nr:fibrobacter succinogenes major paralogous domain-containing protein [Chitinophagaceae bacterium]